MPTDWFVVDMNKSECSIFNHVSTLWKSYFSPQVKSEMFSVFFFFLKEVEIGSCRAVSCGS